MRGKFSRYREINFGISLGNHSKSPEEKKRCVSRQLSVDVAVPPRLQLRDAV